MQVRCQNCGTLFNKYPGEVARTNANFCSKSCAATYNNKKFPKRISARDYICPRCGCRKDHKAAYCAKCVKYFKYRSVQSVPMSKYILSGNARIKYSSVRKWAKLMMDYWKVPCKCCICGFTDVLHVAHVRSISSFPGTTLMGEVNSTENLRRLCPNHHALLDLGKISL